MKVFGVHPAFGRVSPKERKQADLFFEELTRQRIARPSLTSVTRGSVVRPSVATRPYQPFVPQALEREDEAEDFATRELIDETLRKARERATFVPESEVRAALDQRARDPELLRQFERGVRDTSQLRRQYLADRSTQSLTIFWGLLVACAERLLRTIEDNRFRCSAAGNSITLHADVRAGMRTTWTRTGETLTLLHQCGGSPTSCPTAHRALHASGDAAHFGRLSTAGARIVELAGLFGLDLRTVASARRASRAAKQIASLAPLAPLSVVAIRNGTDRELHVARQTPRVVEAFVDSARWKSLPFTATPGTDYTLFKGRWFEASFHRQWGTERCIAWLQGLCAFYRDRAGGLVGIGDVSHMLGEVMTDHGSHRVGLDVDLYVLDAPAANSTFPTAYFTSGASSSLEFRALTPPTPGADPEQYAPPGSRVAALTGATADSVRRRYATIIAYCIATAPQLSAAVWHGARGVAADALQIARDAWTETERAGTGTTARPGWRATWGEGPANLAAIVAPRGALLIGEGSSSYGAGRGWPLHQDHIHVRLR
jgi:hypothetical protein